LFDIQPPLFYKPCYAKLDIGIYGRIYQDPDKIYNVINPDRLTLIEIKGAKLEL
jgi:hypothetical protein